MKTDLLGGSQLEPAAACLTLLAYTCNINPLTGVGIYSATSNNMKLVHWPLMGGQQCYIWYSEEGTGRGRSPPRPLLAVPNVTAHPSTASVPITVLLYCCPFLCSFNVPIKGLTLITTYYYAIVKSGLKVSKPAYSEPVTKPSNMEGCGK